MGLKKFQIVFDNPWSTYYCGQPITGRIIVAVDSPKKIRAITVHFKGESNVKWDEMRTKKNDDGTTTNETVIHSGQEQYFENKYNLIGGSGGEIILEPGEKVYPFNSFLPPNLPSSFEGEFGFIRYTVKAVLDRPWKFDQEVKSAFTVISPLDLNTHPTAKDPFKLEQEKTFCCCCCKSGPLTAVLSLPATGYVPGQNIPVTVEVDNASNVRVDDVHCVLRKVVTFHAQTPVKESKKDKITIAEQSLGSVDGGGSRTWLEHITIPPLPPSNLTNCNIIDLDYDLKVECKVSGIYRNLELKTPIILGTVPLTSLPPPVAPGVSPGGVAPASVISPASVGPGDVPTQWNQIPSGPPPYGPAVLPSGDSQPTQWGPAIPAPGISPSQPQQWGLSVPSPTSGIIAPSTDGQSQQWGPAGPAPAPGIAVQPQQWGPAPVPPLASTQAPAPSTDAQGSEANQWGPATWTVPQPQGPSASPGGSLYPTLAPPTFAESTFGVAKTIHDASDNQYTQGDQQFTPRYPVYNFQPQQK